MYILVRRIICQATLMWWFSLHHSAIHIWHINHSTVFQRATQSSFRLDKLGCASKTRLWPHIWPAVVWPTCPCKAGPPPPYNEVTYLNIPQCFTYTHSWKLLPWDQMNDYLLGCHFYPPYCGNTPHPSKGDAMRCNVWLFNGTTKTYKEQLRCMDKI